MFCQAVWAEIPSIDLLRWAQGISDPAIARVECWHSEWGETNHPWTEWRLIDAHDHCRVRWRVRESLDGAGLRNDENPDGVIGWGGKMYAG